MDLSTEHRPQDLREASTVTAFSEGHQIEIQLGHFCNNRCLFCVSGQLTEEGHAKPIGTEPVFEALSQAAARGIRRVTFLGGEPTIQKSFEPALRHAMALGFDDITIFTNGAMGRHEPFFDRVVGLGEFTWRFSIQGGDEATHDAVTGRRGAFRRIVSALSYLQARGQRITVNMCVNSASYRSLPHFAELVERYGISQLHIDMVRPDHAGRRTEQELRDMVPRVSDLAPWIRAMIAAFDERLPGFDVNIGNLPYCQLPGDCDRIHHGGQPTQTLTTGAGGALDTILDKYVYQAADAVYADACTACVFRTECRGVTRRYAEFYGLDELQPVTAADLAEKDPRQRGFVHEMTDRIRRLSSGRDGFGVASLTRDVRGRRVVLNLVSTSSGEAERSTRLTLLPVASMEAQQRGGLLSTRLAVIGEGPEVDAALGWIRRMLPGDDFRELPPQGDALAALAAAVRRLKSADFGRWTLRAIRRTAGTPVGLRLKFSGADGRPATIQVLAGQPVTVVLRGDEPAALAERVRQRLSDA